MERKYYVIYDFANQPVYRLCYDCDEVDRCLADRDAEIARLRKALVWAARHGVFLNAEMSDVSPVLGYWPDARFGGEPELDLCPGTDASLIDVLCRLVEGE